MKSMRMLLVTMLVLVFSLALASCAPGGAMGPAPTRTPVQMVDPNPTSQGIHPLTPTPEMLVPDDMALSTPTPTSTGPDVLDEIPPTPTPEMLVPPGGNNLAPTGGETFGLPTPIPPRTGFLDPNRPTPTPEMLVPPNLTLGKTPAAPAGLVAGAPQSVNLTTRDGVKLVGSYSAPVDTQRTGETPGLLLVHMFGSDRKVWSNFASLAVRQGYAVLAIDLRGHGESTGERSVESLALDIAAGVDFLSQQEWVTDDRLAIVAASASANAALQVGSQDDRVRAVTLISSPLEFKDLPAAPLVAEYGQYMLFVAGSQDPFAGAEVQSLSEDDNLQIITYDSVEHGTNLLLRQPDLGQRILEWLDQVL